MLARDDEWRRDGTDILDVDARIRAGAALRDAAKERGGTDMKAEVDYGHFTLNSHLAIIIRHHLLITLHEASVLDVR